MENPSLPPVLFVSYRERGQEILWCCSHCFALISSFPQWSENITGFIRNCHSRHCTNSQKEPKGLIQNPLTHCSQQGLQRRTGKGGSQGKREFKMLTERRKWGGNKSKQESCEWHFISANSVKCLTGKSKRHHALKFCLSCHRKQPVLGCSQACPSPPILPFAPRTAECTVSKNKAKGLSFMALHAKHCLSLPFLYWYFCSL